MDRDDPKWNPSIKNAKILDIALKHIESVPYKVSLRWVFYRLLQEGIYKRKTDYCKLKDIVSRARHTGYNNWKPNTLADETRYILWSGVGAIDEKDAIDEITCYLDKFQVQEYALIILYEAKAMTGQFKHYTKHIPLVPFGGDPSIPFKYKTAVGISMLGQRYNLPVIVLYFGDCDKKGNEIRKTALKHIRKWCSVNFEVIHCGLTLEQAQKYDLPENPEKPGQYQWESLEDKQAEEIIISYVSKYQDTGKIEEIKNEEKKLVEKWKEKLGADE